MFCSISIDGFINSNTQNHSQTLLMRDYVRPVPLIMTLEEAGKIKLGPKRQMYLWRTIWEKIKVSSEKITSSNILQHRGP